MATLWLSQRGKYLLKLSVICTVYKYILHRYFPKMFTVNLIYREHFWKVFIIEIFLFTLLPPLCKSIHTGKCSFSISLSFFIFSVHRVLSSTNASLISSGKASVNSSSLIKNKAAMARIASYARFCSKLD